MSAKRGTMLFVLTGDVQIGKTRWLERLVADLELDGVESRGVLAPGIWRVRTSENGDDDVLPLESDEVAAGAQSASTRHGDALHPPESEQGLYEKLGIDNVLLPQGERVRFALRRDLAEHAGRLNLASQSAAAHLGWEISEEALARVNAHFVMLVKASHTEQQGSTTSSPTRLHFLVVDELGRLELERGGGLIAAMNLLQRGPTSYCPHALVVVRDRLLQTARDILADAWGEVHVISPNSESRRLVRNAFGLS